MPVDDPLAPVSLAALLQDCLALWQVAGTIMPDDAGLAIETDGGRFTLHPAAPPMRWRIETPARRAAGRGPRMAPSISAALLVLRNAIEA